MLTCQILDIREEFSYHIIKPMINSKNTLS